MTIKIASLALAAVLTASLCVGCSDEDLIPENRCLAADADGLAIVQIFPKEDEAVPLQHLERTEERRYGSTLLVFFEPC